MKNKERKANNKDTVVGLLIVVLSASIIIYVLSMLFSAFNALSDELKASIIQVIGIVSVAIVSYFTSKSVENRRAFESSIRKNKVELYDKYISFYFEVFSNEELGLRPTQEEMTKFIVNSNPAIVTYASNGVIKKMGKLRLNIMSNENTTNSLFLIEDIMVEMRKDLGHSRNGFKKGDIMRLTVNDIDNYIDIKPDKNNNVKKDKVI